MNEQVIIKSQYAYHAKKMAVLTFCLFFVVDLAVLTVYSFIRWPTGSYNWYDQFSKQWTTQYRVWSPGCIIDAFEELAAVAIVILVVGITAAIIISKFKSDLTVTTKRAYGMGIFGKRVDLPLDSISAIGSLSFFKGVSIATSSGSIKFFGIKNYKEIHEVMSKLLIERQDNKQQEAYSAPAVPAFSDADELKKYKELLDDGVITQEEFDAKKKQILDL